MAKTVVLFPRLQCPKCGAFDPIVRATAWPLRYHECRNAKCGFRFQTYDHGPRKGEDAPERFEGIQGRGEAQTLDTSQQAKGTGAFQGVTLEMLRARNRR